MEKQYDHKKIEPTIYKMWEENGCFKPEGGSNTKNKTFTVLMPPPNANASLHCGHATYAIQDLMCRWKRMQGFKTLYLPGMDHAGFETQVVYERHLKKQGKSRFDFDREDLYNQIYKFVMENSDVATNQLKQIGIGADWSKSTFMLDQKVLDRVFETFTKMYKEGLVYRDNYMVNYSPHHGTTFSTLETTHVARIVPLYYVSYLLKDSSEKITVATVRPETIFADVAIAVHPEDPRYSKYVGKMVLNPLNDMEIPVIADSYVDIEFGTGALKITPGHDFNDYEIGKKHGFPAYSVIDLEGRMTSDTGVVAGMRAGTARIKTAEILQEKGALEKINDKYETSLLVDYKDEKPIEPMLLPNWFVKMDGLSGMAKDAIQKNKVKFYKPMWKKEMIRWLDNIKDWPISRQTIFGIRIPVWYSISENQNLFVVFLDENKTSHEGNLSDFLKDSNFSLNQIKNGLQKIIAPVDAKFVVSVEAPSDDYLPETDTFDTWFSSGQWPLTTTGFPDSEIYKEFFPTDFLDSMWDIMFFWIARMIMFSLYLTGEVPFKTVYFHGAITDEKGQKMSKSKGNVINPIDVVAEFGADALRMGIMVGGNTSAKNTALSMDKVRGYRNFGNKIWNMTRFMNMMFENYEGEVPVYSSSLEAQLTSEDKEILSGLNGLIKSVNTNLGKYRILDAGDEIYHFLWNEVADKYIENVKTREELTDKGVALSVLRYVMITCLKLLHPFMPFVTEAVWENIPDIQKIEGKMLVVAAWPEA